MKFRDWLAFQEKVLDQGNVGLQWDMPTNTGEFAMLRSRWTTKDGDPEPNVYRGKSPEEMYGVSRDRKNRVRPKNSNILQKSSPLDGTEVGKSNISV